MFPSLIPRDVGRNSDHFIEISTDEINRWLVLGRSCHRKFHLRQVGLRRCRGDGPTVNRSGSSLNIGAVGRASALFGLLACGRDIIVGAGNDWPTLDPGKQSPGSGDGKPRDGSNFSPRRHHRPRKRLSFRNVSYGGETSKPDYDTASPSRPRARNVPTSLNFNDSCVHDRRTPATASNHVAPARSQTTFHPVSLV